MSEEKEERQREREIVMHRLMERIAELKCAVLFVGILALMIAIIISITGCSVLDHMPWSDILDDTNPTPTPTDTPTIDPGSSPPDVSDAGTGGSTVGTDPLIAPDADPNAPLPTTDDGDGWHAPIYYGEIGNQGLPCGICLATPWYVDGQTSGHNIYLTGVKLVNTETGEVIWYSFKSFYYESPGTANNWWFEKGYGFTTCSTERSALADGTCRGRATLPFNKPGVWQVWISYRTGHGDLAIPIITLFDGVDHHSYYWRWDQSGDGRHYTIMLHTGVRFMLGESGG